MESDVIIMPLPASVAAAGFCLMGLECRMDGDSRFVGS